MSDPFTPSPPAPGAPTTAKKQNRSGSILLAAAALVAVAGIAFAAGRLTAPAAAAAGGTGGNGGGRFGGFPGASFAPGQFRGGGPNSGGFGGLAGGIELRGQVTGVSSTSITVKLANGSDVTVPLDSSTTYHQATPATSSAVAVGSTVAIQPGAANFAPGGSANPEASGAPGFGGVTFGPATDVTVVTEAATTATTAP